MTEQLHENIYRIIIPLPENPLRSLNSYVITSEQRNLLIDTGFRRPECLKSLQDGIEELGLDMSKTDIFVTHLHADHSGLAKDIADENSKVYMSRADMDFLRYTRLQQDEYLAYSKKEYLKQGYPEEVWEDSLKDNPAILYAMDGDFPFTEVTDGQIIKIGDYDIQCVLTPGHTPGHVCLYIESEKILFSADHILFDITPNITSWKVMEDALGDYLNSLDKIEKFDIEKTFSGHRENDFDTYSRIKALKQHHADRLDELYEIIKQNPGINGHDAAARMKWSIRAKNWEEFPATQKWFAVGEATAHLIHLEKLGKISKEMLDGVYRYNIK